MGIGEWIAWVAVLLLALYGCACLLRWICLRMSVCPRTVRLYRVAVPESGRALEPLIRCLQAQAAWREEEGRTLLLLPGMSPAEKAVAERLLAENPAVLPVTVQELAALLTAEEY